MIEIDSDRGYPGNGGKNGLRTPSSRVYGGPSTLAGEGERAGRRVSRDAARRGGALRFTRAGVGTSRNHAAVCARCGRDGSEYAKRFGVKTALRSERARSVKIF